MATISSFQSAPGGAVLTEMKLRRFVAAVALLVLLELSLIGASPLANWSRAEGPQNDVVRQVLLLGTLAIQLLLPARTRPPMAVPASLLLLLGYCLLSATWAIAPGISLRRLAFTAAVIWILVRAIGDLGAVRTLEVVRTALAVLLVINYAVALFSYAGRHMDLEEGALIGNWRGIMNHKNAAGSACALLILMFTFDRGRVPAWLSALFIAASLFFLYMSQSKTSIGMLALGLGVGGLVRYYNPHNRSVLLPIGLVSALLLIGFGSAYAGLIEVLLDDPASFSGRGEIWRCLLVYARENPWWGAGYGSFWGIGLTSPIWDITSSWVATEVSHGHNGYLDILVTIGLPGLLLTLAVVFIWPATRVLCSISISRSRRALLCAIMAFAAGHNLTESTLMDRASAVQVFLMMAVILIHRLSDQSAGVHQALRGKILELATRRGLARARSRLVAGPRVARNAVGWRREPGGRTALDAEDGEA